MRRSPLLLLAAALLTFGVSACGGGESSPPGEETTTTGESSAKSGAGGETAPAAQRSDGKPGSGSTKGETGGGGGKPGGGGGTAGSGGAAGKAGSEGSAGGKTRRFTPKHHDDSGGGSAQFEVKGGDNSIQEFGSEAGGSEFGEVATALHDFLDARSQGDWAAACGYLASSVAKSLEQLAARAEQAGGTSCAAALSTLTNPAAMDQLRAEAARADVGSVRVEGERGFAIYTVGETVYGIPMAKEGGSWKAGGIAAVPLSWAVSRDSAQRSRAAGTEDMYSARYT